MNDGIIKGEGNSRYLKTVADFLSKYPTYEAFARAFMEGTLPIDLNGINEAGWDQLPTWLNKENLLKDLTSAIYNKGVDATLNDVLESVFAIGDIKVSIRTDLSDNWLLCNGEFFDESEYPVLSAVSPKSAIQWTNKYTFSATVSLVKYVNGYIVVKLSDNALYYATKPSGPWTSIPHDNVLNIKDVGFFAGKYFLINGGSAMFVSSTLDGPWEDVSSIVQFSYNYTSHIVSGGKLFVASQDGGTTYIDIFTSLEKSKLKTAVLASVSEMFTVDGVVIVCSYNGASPSMMCSNPDSDDPSFNKTAPLNFFGYGAAKVGEYTFYFSDSSSSGGDKLYRCNDIKQADPDSDTMVRTVSSSNAYINSLGNLILVGHPNGSSGYVYDADTLENFGNTTTKPVISSSLIAQTYTELIGISNKNIVWSDSLIAPSTPVISIENAYAYIRGK